MSRLLDLKRRWRDVHADPDATIADRAKILAWDEVMLDRFGMARTDALAGYTCIFLLGAPGAGKSTEVQRIGKGLVGGFSEEYTVVLTCKEIDAEVDDEVAREPRWRQAAAQDKPVRLILDALDEGYLRNHGYFLRLRRGLENIRSQHPKLRLALICRPSEWDQAFGQLVHSMWGGQGKPSVFALEPLSSVGKKLLVEARGVRDNTKFFQWIRLNNFEEFTAWPRSLEWLADQFCTDAKQKVTYTELCRLRTQRSFGDEAKRIVEANRAERVQTWTHALTLVAATLMFSGRKGVTLEGGNQDCLTLDEMFLQTGSIEMHGKPPLSREDVFEAISVSPLMEPAENHRRFQNQSDLEYLAAGMLISLRTEQRAELFGCPDERGRWRVFPQLATTAANLATQSDDFFGWLLAHDPRVLLRVDFASKSGADRREAIAAILKATAEADATADHDKQAHLTTLRHEGIDEQMKPWLFDPSRSFAVRDLAFDIAFACCGKAFWEEFDRITEAKNDEFLAARMPTMLMRYGWHLSTDRLKTLAASPRNNLAGAAMAALLEQGHLPRELAPFLRRPTGHGYDAYDLLLDRVTAHCQLDDVPFLLPVIAPWSSVGEPSGAVHKLAETLVVKAIDAMARQDVRDALAAFLIARLERYDHWFAHKDVDYLARFGLRDPERRHALMLLLAEKWPSGSREELMPFNSPLLREDYPWLLETLTTARGHVATILAKAASQVAWQIEEEQWNLLDAAYEASDELRALLPPADEAGIFATLRRLRAEADEKHRLKKEEYERKQQRPGFDHQRLLKQSLQACRQGRPGSWVNVCYALSEPGSEQDASDFFRCTDIRQLHGWQGASEDARREFAGFARDFLLRVDVPEPEPQQIPGEFFGLVYALSLHAPSFKSDHELRQAVRPIWIQALLRHCSSVTESVSGVLRILSAAAPDAAREGYAREFSASWTGNSPIYNPIVSDAWSAESENALTQVLQSSPLQPASYQSGLRLLAKHNPLLAARIAEERLTKHASQPDSAARRAALAVCLFTVNSLWEKAWPHVVANSAGARQLVLECCRWADSPARGQHLSEATTKFIGLMYDFMLKIFPLKDAPRIVAGEGRVLGAIDEAYELQSTLQRTLEARGAHNELKRIYDTNVEVKDAWWLGKSLEHARTNAHAERRQPPNASDFIRFLATEGGRFVRDNDSLQRAVLDSLVRYERQLHPDGIVALWEGKKPRREEALQTEIARHLKQEFEQRKIVVNMETKVQGSERADLRVEAGSFCVIIEVKLGHSKDKLRSLLKSMRTQLRDNYLVKSGNTHGVYVVGWYFGKNFRTGIPRGIASLRAARTYFAGQAKKLSTGPYSLAASVIDCSWWESVTAKTERLTQR